VTHLAIASRSAALVTAADKLHNAQAILRDYRQEGDRLAEAVEDHGSGPAGGRAADGHGTGQARVGLRPFKRLGAGRILV
jgi:hypothetical protein